MGGGVVVARPKMGKHRYPFYLSMNLIVCKKLSTDLYYTYVHNNFHQGSELVNPSFPPPPPSNVLIINYNILLCI